MNILNSGRFSMGSAVAGMLKKLIGMCHCCDKILYKTLEREVGFGSQFECMDHLGKVQLESISGCGC